MVESVVVEDEVVLEGVVDSVLDVVVGDELVVVNWNVSEKLSSR